jgi:hypothetical protein
VDDLYERSDLDADEARRFVAAWWTGFRDAPTTPGELFALAGHTDVALPLSGRDEHARRCGFGRYLDRQRGRPYAIADGLNVTITKPRSGGRPLWRLVAGNGHKAGKRGESRESGESLPATHGDSVDLISDQKRCSGESSAERLSPDSLLSPKSAELDL